MAVIIVDSDTLIDALAGRQPSAASISRGLEAGSLATTAISVFELLSGARTPGEIDSVETLLDALPVIPFDAAAARAAAHMRRELESRGETIGMADYQIAAICVSRSASLLTRNRRHFERIESLALVEL